MTNIQDVAKRAGVAPITVSRVINHSGYVTQEVRERVESAVAEMGYVPNSLARSLRSKRTHTLALVLTDITNPFFTTVARGVEDFAIKNGYTVIFCNTDESEEKELMYIKMLLQNRVDGFLLVPASSTSQSILMIQRHAVSLVVIDRRVTHTQVDVVRGESVEAAYKMTQFLIRLGHRRIAMLTGRLGVSTTDDRVDGFQRAMQEADLGEPVIKYGAFSLDSGYEMACQVLSVHPRPTALFAANNFIAIGALNALRESGLRVPEDISLVGFDDLPPALITYPFFTVVLQPAYEIGKAAAELLILRLKDQSYTTHQEIVFPTEVIVRQSSGAASGYSILS